MYRLSLFIIVFCVALSAHSKSWKVEYSEKEGCFLMGGEIEQRSGLKPLKGNIHFWYGAGTLDIDPEMLKQGFESRSHLVSFSVESTQDVSSQDDPKTNIHPIEWHHNGEVITNIIPYSEETAGNFSSFLLSKKQAVEFIKYIQEQELVILSLYTATNEHYEMQLHKADFNVRSDMYLACAKHVK